jgi:integrase
MAKIRSAAKRDKPPEKPYPDFPLFAHQTGRWAKKVRGRTVYFGKWGDPFGSLDQWEREKADLLAGRTPRLTGDGLTVRDLLNRFLTSKSLLIKSREIESRTFSDYKRTCDRIHRDFGPDRFVNDLAAEDFDSLRANIAKKWGPVALANEVQRVRSVFKWGYDAALIDRPVRFGPNFVKPSQRTIRRAKAAKGPRPFDAKGLKAALDKAGVPLRAMLYLGINCGLGNKDCGRLTKSALDLKAGWLDFPRPKTGVARRCWLWPETVKALRAALAVRPAPRDPKHSDRVFLTIWGNPWEKDTADSPISKATAELLTDLGIRRPGLSFYSLRHTFQTVAGEAKDEVAINCIMGHADVASDMSAN